MLAFRLLGTKAEVTFWRNIPSKEKNPHPQNLNWEFSGI